jgi:ATP-dependent exoDNAse (exonuclease V) alpha subunit
MKLFIVDEASMVPANALRAIDSMLQDITKTKVPFGGKVFLMGGDFRQVLPVVPRQPRTVIIENCIKSSPLWQHFKVIKLIKNMRAEENQHQYAQWLLQLGNGELTSAIENSPPNSVDIPTQCNILTADNIIDAVFADVANADTISSTVILATTNDTTLHLNDLIIKKHPGQGKTYLSADKAICDDDTEADNYPIEFLNSITPSGMPPHQLILKTGAIIMLLRNLDISKGLCNGTRLSIGRLHEHILDAEVIAGTAKGQRVLIPRIKLAPSDHNLPFTLQRVQFPVRLAYSMIINKAQGQTFNKLGIFLPTPVFSHGQLFVAFSRAKSFKNIFVQVMNNTTQGKVRHTTITQNIVYREIP